MGVWHPRHSQCSLPPCSEDLLLRLIKMLCCRDNRAFAPQELWMPQAEPQVLGRGKRRKIMTVSSWAPPENEYFWWTPLWCNRGTKQSLAVAVMGTLSTLTKRHLCISASGWRDNTATFVSPFFKTFMKLQPVNKYKEITCSKFLTEQPNYGFGCFIFPPPNDCTSDKLPITSSREGVGKIQHFFGKCNFLGKHQI